MSKEFNCSTGALIGLCEANGFTRDAMRNPETVDKPISFKVGMKGSDVSEISGMQIHKALASLEQSDKRNR